MITRRGFFGTVAALVVGGGAARLRLTPSFWRNPSYLNSAVSRAFDRVGDSDHLADTSRYFYGGFAGGGKTPALWAEHDDWVRRQLRGV